MPRCVSRMEDVDMAVEEVQAWCGKMFDESFLRNSRNRIFWGSVAYSEGIGGPWGDLERLSVGRV